jgi:tetratricopeptide (TPR) repeat protein
LRLRCAKTERVCGDLFDGLAYALCAEEALPELVSGETTVAMIADFLRRNPAGIEFGLSSALDRASAELKRQDELDLQAQEQSLRDHGRIADADVAIQKIAELGKAMFPSRLVLAIDQLEELFTLESITPERRIGKLDLLAEISNRVRAYYQNFADRERSPEALKQWSTALINQGDVFTDQGDLDAALKCYEESLSIRQNLFQQNSQSTESKRDVGTALSKIAGNRHARGNFASELTNYEQALAIRRGVVKTKPENQEFRHDLSTALRDVGKAAHNMGDEAKALQNLREAITVDRSIMEAESAPAAWQNDLSYALLLAGDVLTELNNSSEALQDYEDSLAIRERLAKATLQLKAITNRRINFFIGRLQGS